MPKYAITFNLSIKCTIPYYTTYIIRYVYSIISCSSTQFTLPVVNSIDCQVCSAHLLSDFFLFAEEVKKRESVREREEFMADKMQKVNGERRLCTQMKVQGMGRYHRRMKLHSREDMMQKITDMLSMTSISGSRGELQIPKANTDVRNRAMDKSSAVPRCISEPPQGIDVENDQICELDMSLEQMSIDTASE